MIEERDIIVTMRDVVRLAVDVYRPDSEGPLPSLYASALHSKDVQGPASRLTLMKCSSQENRPTSISPCCVDGGVED